MKRYIAFFIAAAMAAGTIPAAAAAEDNETDNLTDTGITENTDITENIDSFDISSDEDAEDMYDLETAGDDTAVQMEYLDRGTAAVKVSKGVFISWRLLGTENYDTTYDVYRGTTKIAAAVSKGTCYSDASGTVDDTYTVVKNGEKVSSGKAVSVWKDYEAADSSYQNSGRYYLSIPLDKPADFVSEDNGNTYSYSANDAECADVDGDGEYEIILKWDPANSFDSGKGATHSGNVYIDCYKLDGTKLWRIDMGKNINAGAHFTQIAAYDFDLDGKAEIALKTAPGTIDGQGNYVSAASKDSTIASTDNTADYRYNDTGSNGDENTGGRVLAGPEYYTLFQADTGAAIDTVYYPHPRGSVTEWGDNWGNRSERYLTAVAYLDGETPSVIAWRGYYAKTTATAYNVVNKRLVQIGDFDTSKPGYESFAGQGNHNSIVGDCDLDGRDEILCGSLCLGLDENGSLEPEWNIGRGHGDASHLADYDPMHLGMEYFMVHEHSPFGMTVVYPEDGTEVYHRDNSKDTGRGIMANYNGKGYYQIWANGTDYKDDSGFNNYNSGGSLISRNANFRIFWDGEVDDELMDGTGSSNTYMGIQSSSDGRVATLLGITNNDTKNNPCLQADIIGDWREEVIMRDSSSTALKVYTSTISTDNRLYTLMHDRAYRMQAAQENSAYNQPPHISYYVSTDNAADDYRQYAAYVKTVHNGETETRTQNLPSGYDPYVTVKIHYKDSKGTELKEPVSVKSVVGHTFYADEKYLEDFGYDEESNTCYRYFGGNTGISTGNVIGDTVDYYLRFENSNAFINASVNAVDANGNLIKTIKTDRVIYDSGDSVSYRADYGFVLSGKYYILSDNNDAKTTSYVPTEEEPDKNIVYKEVYAKGKLWDFEDGKSAFTTTRMSAAAESAANDANINSSVNGNYAAKITVNSKGINDKNRYAKGLLDVSSYTSSYPNITVSYDAWIPNASSERMLLGLLGADPSSCYDTGMLGIGVDNKNSIFKINGADYSDYANTWIHGTITADTNTKKLYYTFTDNAANNLITSGSKDITQSTIKYISMLSWAGSTTAYIDNISVVAYNASAAQPTVAPRATPAPTATPVPTAAPTPTAPPEYIMVDFDNTTFEDYGIKSSARRTASEVDETFADTKTLKAAMTSNQSDANQYSYIRWDLSGITAGKKYLTVEYDLYAENAGRLRVAFGDGGFTAGKADAVSGGLINQGILANANEPNLIKNAWVHTKIAANLENGTSEYTVTDTSGRVIGRSVYQTTLSQVTVFGLISWSPNTSYIDNFEVRVRDSAPVTEIVSVNGTEITAASADGTQLLYAVQYDTDGVLKGIKKFDVKEIDQKFDAGFEPDKVFLWKADQTPVDNWTKQ